MNTRHHLPIIILSILTPFIGAGCQSGAPDRASAGEMEPSSASAADEPGAVDAPATAVSDADEAVAAMRDLLETTGVHYRPEDEQIEVRGWVNMQSGLIEVFACAPEGKTHEAVVVLDCVPSGLHAGLLALGLNPGTPAARNAEGDYIAPTGDAVVIEVSWKDPSGVPQTARAEDWIWNEAVGASMPRVAWIFTGSIVQSVPGNPDLTTYGANYVKSLVTTYNDPTTVIENPLREGNDDTLYFANDRAVPDVGTPVRVTFRSAP